MTYHIVAIGPLPPPVHGFSLATSAMMDLLSEDNAVVVQNLAPPATGWRLLRHPVKFAKTLRAGLSLFRHRRHADKRCYIACDGGLGQLSTLLLVATARLLSYPTYLHHHSFRYIDKPSVMMRGILALSGPDLTHIFLCDIMRDRFTDAYARRVRSTILSNAAFIAPQGEIEPQSRPLTIGMLSNLSRAKGLDSFIALFRQIRNDGLPIRAIIAGPVADIGDRATIDAAVMAFGGALEYRGPVYGVDKARFYTDIDVFIFPTTYVNEAQPIVIFEAKAAGNAAIAYDRGCIRKQLDETDLLIPVNGAFEATASAWLCECAAGNTRQSLRRRIRQQYQNRHVEALQRAKSLMR
jgi:glycosyltransferase involved in cell wall biosynthesis